MSIQSEINRITGFRDSSLSAVSGKGVVVPSGSAIDDLPELIQRIPDYSAVAEYDPANGTTTINHIAVKLGDLSWTYNSNYSRFQSTSLQSLINKPSAQAAALAGLFCQNYKTVGASYVTATDKSIGVATTGVLLIRDSGYTQATAFKAAMGDVTIVLPLETPISGGGNVIGFYINDTSFIAKEGMTWAEWCASDYNTVGAYIENNVVWYAPGSQVDVDNGANSVIIANQRYYIIASGGSGN